MKEHEKLREQLISYDTACLAKEKGYDDVAVHIFRTSPYNDIVENINELIHSDGENPIISAPTQHLLQKWLRDRHQICVLIRPLCKTPNGTGYFSFVVELVRHYKEAIVLEGSWMAYEEALEMGLREALELIK